MKNKEESAKNPERDQRPATPLSTLETLLTVSAHERFLYPRRAKRNSGNDELSTSEAASS